MFKNPPLDKNIAADLYRIHGDLSKQTLKKCMKYPGFRQIYLIRKWKKSDQIGKKYYGYLIKRNSIKYGFQIPPNTEIGRGFRIYHFGNIIINPYVKIGKYCSVFPNCIIGNIDFGGKKGTPTIGNKVWIGANSIIVGNIIIEDNVLIAPGAYVNFNVPSNSIIIGNPGIIIKKNDPTRGYIDNLLENFY